MRVIRRSAIQRFAESHADALEPLVHWANAVEGMTWKSSADISRAFISTTFQRHMTVFHLGANRFPAVALVHYARDIVLIMLGPDSLGVDTKRYRRSLTKALPTTIESAEENNRTLAVVEELMEKGEGNLTTEEDALLDLLADLAYDFEEINVPLPSPQPHKFLGFLLEQRGLTPKDLEPVLGSESVVSSALSGSAPLTGDQARTLARFFAVGLYTLRDPSLS